MLKFVEENPRVLKLFAWTGPMVVAAWIAALVGGGFIPPDSANSTPQEVTSFYTDHQGLLRLATVVLMVSGSLWATWGAAISVLVRRMEVGRLFTYTVVALVGGGYVFFEFVALFWGVAAFRPGELSPQITQTLHDLGWFSVLFDWPPFALFNVVLAAAILQDKSVPSVLPRWVAWMSLWCAFIFIPAGAIVFFHTGPLSYAGVLALYIPLGVFFLWMVAFTVGVMGAINRDATRLAERDRAPSRAEARDAEAALA